MPETAKIDKKCKNICIYRKNFVTLCGILDKGVKTKDNRPKCSPLSFSEHSERSIYKQV